MPVKYKALVLSCIDPRFQPIVFEYLKKKYGNWIVYDPEINKNTILLWVIPLILFIFGGILIIRKVSIK